MSLREISQTLSSLIVHGLLDWKMPIFRGLLYAIAPAITAIYAGLQDYHSMADVDELTWLKIQLSAGAASIAGLTAFLDSSFTRTKDRLNQKENENTQHPLDHLAPRP